MGNYHNEYARISFFGCGKLSGAESFNLSLCWTILVIQTGCFWTFTSLGADTVVLLICCSSLSSICFLSRNPSRASRAKLVVFIGFGFL